MKCTESRGPYYRSSSKSQQTVTDSMPHQDGVNFARQCARIRPGTSPPQWKVRPVGRTFQARRSVSEINLALLTERALWSSRGAKLGGPPAATGHTPQGAHAQLTRDGCGLVQQRYGFGAVLWAALLEQTVREVAARPAKIGLGFLYRGRNSSERETAKGSTGRRQAGVQGRVLLPR